MNKAVIMDRDGTIVKDCHFLSDPKHLQIYKGVFPALRKLGENGWKLIIGTNQSGVGRGYFGVDAVHLVHDRLIELFEKERVKINEIYFCPHHPDDNCVCRKPELGMLTQAARKFQLDLRQCVVVGDKESDILWGKRGGTRTVLVLTGKGKKTRRKMKQNPDYVSKSFYDAAKWILKNG